MNHIPDLCDGRFIQRQCVQSLLRRANTKSSLQIKHLMLELVPNGERKNVPAGLEQGSDAPV
jgi:hypothetical protein